MLSVKRTILSFALTTAALPLFAQEIAVEGPVPTSALISVESKSGEPLNSSLLVLQINRHDSPITTVTPITKSNAQVAILIDEGLRSSFGLHVKELQKFIVGLPPGVKVMVGYMQNGTVQAASGFSASHEEIASQVRIPMSVGGISASPYFCLSDFVKRWPAGQPGARVVLMLTNGVDPYNGSTSIMNQDSPYVQQAQNDAERAGVAVYSIYYGDSGMRGARGSFSGQSYLQQVAQATGGQSYNQGTITPPSITPYLDQFGKALTESYIVGFQASTSREKRDTLTEIQLKSKQAGVKIHAPEGVHPGVSDM